MDRKVEEELARLHADQRFTEAATLLLSAEGARVLGYLTATLRDGPAADEVYARTIEAAWAALPRFEVEEGRLKVNPLADWDKARIETYFEEHDLPPHPLVAQGYPSIGCAPCTSMVKPGEDPRAGRWRGWDKVECGIHTPITDPDDPANLPAF